MSRTLNRIARVILGCSICSVLLLPALALAAPSPTGRSPRLLWTPERQDVWLRMKADYEQGRPTLGATWYKVLKEDADCGCKYGDFGLRATLMYQITGDPKYVEIAWQKLGGYPTSTSWSANSTREYSAEHVVIYDWLYPGLTQERRSLMLGALNREANEIATHPNSPEMPVLPTDSDQTVGNYFGLAFLYLATNDHNPTAGEIFNRPFVGGLTATAAARGNMRNVIRLYVERMAAGGEWIESSEYNLGTLRLLMMGVEGVRTATGQEHFPEARAFFLQAATRPLNFATPDLKMYFEYGDVEEPRSFKSHLYAWVTTAGMLQGLVQQDATVGPMLQDHIYDLVEQYGATGYQSTEPWPRLFYFYNPYAARGDRTAAPLAWYAPGQGVLFSRTGWGVNDSAFMAHFRPGQDTVHHQVSYFGDFQLYRRGAMAITHPLSYGGPSMSGDGTNSMKFGPFSAALEYRSINGQYSSGDVSYLGGTTAGQSYGMDYYDPPPTFIHEWSRSLVYLPSRDRRSDTVVVYDRVNAEPPQDLAKFTRYRAGDREDFLNAPSIKQWFFHMETQPTVTGNTMTWTTAGNQLGKLTQVSGAELRTEVQNQQELYASNNKVRQNERKWGVRLTPVNERPWDTALHLVQVADSGAFGTGTAVRSANAEAEGVLLKRPGDPNYLLMFSAMQGARVPGPVVVGGVRQSSAQLAEILRNARVLGTGYTTSWTSDADTQLVFFDLDPQFSWTVNIDGGQRALPVHSSGVARIEVAGAGSHTATLSPSGAAPRPAAPRNLRISGGQ